MQLSLPLGFGDLVIEGDNTTVMHKITDFGASSFRLGHIFLDIHSSLAGISWFSVFYSMRG